MFPLLLLLLLFTVATGLFFGVAGDGKNERKGFLFSGLSFACSLNSLLLAAKIRFFLGFLEFAGDVVEGDAFGDPVEEEEPDGVVGRMCRLLT